MGVNAYAMTTQSFRLIIALSLAFTTGCSDTGAGDDDRHNPTMTTAFADTGDLRSSQTYVYRVWRPTRSAFSVLDRARTLAVVLTGDEYIESVDALEAVVDLDYWETAAKAAPTKRGAATLEIGGHVFFVTYLPATDTLTLSLMDITDRDPPTMDPENPTAAVLGVGEAGALAAARRCADELATRGVLPSRVFAPEPVQKNKRMTRLRGVTWVQQYDFVFAPSLDGLPLRSMDLRIGVAGQSGQCRHFSVNEVRYERAQATTSPPITSDEAHALLRSRLITELGVDDVDLAGYIGYILPSDQIAGEIAPHYIGEYATVKQVGDSTTVSRRRMVALPLNDPNGPLVDVHPGML